MDHLMGIDVVKELVVAYRIVEQEAIGERGAVKLWRIRNAPGAEGWCSGSQAGAGIEAALCGEEDGADEGRGYDAWPEPEPGGFQLQPDETDIVVYHFPEIPVGGGIFYDGVSHIKNKARQVAVAQFALHRDQGVDAFAAIHDHAASRSHGKSFGKGLVPFLAFMLIDHRADTARHGTDEAIVKQGSAAVILRADGLPAHAHEQQQYEWPGKENTKR